jgi:oligoribonuclease
MIDYIVIGDTETTGLAPEGSSLLEIAFVIADQDLNLLAQASWLWPSSTGQNRVQELYAATNPKVQAMHNENGLWKELFEADPNAKTEEQVADEICACFAQIGVSANSQTELTGRNPNFDLRFLKAYAPRIADLFSYHVIDICSFQRLIGKTYGREAEYKYKYEDGKPHRALSDCINELAELKYYKTNFINQIKL